MLPERSQGHLLLIKKDNFVGKTFELNANVLMSYCSFSFTQYAISLCLGAITGKKVDFFQAMFVNKQSCFLMQNLNILIF